jgi:flagellar basal-body rod protein FlgB
MSRTLFPTNIDVLQKNLALRMARHQVLASNIANAETPGYLAKDVSFEAALRDAVAPLPKQAVPQRTHPRHLSTAVQSLADVQGTLVASPSDDVGRDLNTVSMDQEMGRVTLNTFHYNTSIEFLSRSFDQLRRTISEGGR